DNGIYTATVTVSDGTASTQATTQVNISDVAPTASFASGGSVVVGSAGSVQFSNIVDTAPDIAAGFTFNYDFNNDGTYDVIGSISTSATVPSSYLTATGSHTIRGQVIDKDGLLTTYTATIDVVVAPTSSAQFL